MLGLETESVPDPAKARTVCELRPPAIVLLDLTLPPEDLIDAYELMSELSSRNPPVPVLVISEHDTFSNRVEAARRGGRGFLKASSASEVLDAAMQFLARERLQSTRILMVDDDLIVLAATRALLEQHEIEVSTLAEPLRFWDKLEQVSPELVILDVDMPGVNGPELCRVLRNDVRWSQIGVVFVSGHHDPATIQSAFRAGADDFLTKPILGSELIARVSNRLERIRLQRVHADTDSLTGLASRAKAGERLAQLISLAERFVQPLSVALLDLDRFKQVNDNYGHAAGDTVLRALGERLQRDFRGEDIVGRWGGEEFLVGMYGISRADGVKRLNDTLLVFGKETFTAGSHTLTVSFSAGVAQYPLDGTDLQALLDASDAALYRAKGAGRGQVLASPERDVGDKFR